MRLVGGVDAHALEGAPSWWGRRATQPRQVDVARDDHRDEVRHDAAGRQDPEAALVVADEVAQPAEDLLLDERADRARMPDVDALLRDLREHLAGHGGEQGRRREVAERARVVGTHRVRRDPRRELAQHGVEGVGLLRRRRRSAASPEELGAQGRVLDRCAHGSDERVVVQVVEGRLPDRRAGGPQRLARPRLVAHGEQLRLGVPVDRGLRGACAHVGHSKMVAKPIIVGIFQDDEVPMAPGEQSPRSGVEYKGAPLEAEKGPGLGCFWLQIVVLAVVMVLTPLSAAWEWPVPVTIVLLAVTLVLLLFVGQTIIFLLRLVAADRRATGRRRPMGSATRTVGEIEDEGATLPTSSGERSKNED